MTATPIRATKPPASLPENGEPTPTAELEILKNNIALWREVTDEAFERHFRQKYFGNESISRQEAIERLVAIGAKRFRIAPVYETARQDANGSVATWNELAESAAKARVAPADIQILLLPEQRSPMALNAAVHPGTRTDSLVVAFNPTAAASKPDDRL